VRRSSRLGRRRIVLLRRGPLAARMLLRRLSTREEEAAALEDYLKELEAEAKGVRERLAEIRP